MQMPGRVFSSGSYRYGFNGKENDNEVKGTGNQQDYGMRIYDSRLGKFLSVDPLSSKYAMLTPYQFASNTPIQAIDLDGLEAAVSTFYFTSQKDAKVKLANADLIVDKTKPRSEAFMIVIDGAKFQANSYRTLEGRDDRNNFIGDFSGIRTLSSNDLAGILGYADFVIDAVHRGHTEQAVYNESNAGPGKSKAALLDFKNRLYELFNFKQDELIAIDGVAYNANEAGNYLWGMVLAEAGTALNANFIAENATRRHDEPNEQKAIKAGINKALSWLKGNAPSAERRKEISKRYTQEWSAFKSDGGGMDNYKASDNLGVFKESDEKNQDQ